jgi:hypothetical protein
VAETLGRETNEAIAKASQAAAERALGVLQAGWVDWGTALKAPMRYAIPSICALPSDTAHKGKCILIGHPAWSQGHTYISPVFVDPTWSTVLFAFDASIQVTEDHQHVFLEGLYEAEPEEYPKGMCVVPYDVKILRFSANTRG